MCNVGTFRDLRHAHYILFFVRFQVIMEYEKIKRTAELSRDLFGGAILCFYLCGLAYLATMPYFIMQSSTAPVGRSPTLVASVSVYAIVICMIVYMAASVNGKVRLVLLFVNKFL